MAENPEETILIAWREERDELNKLIAALEKRLAAKSGLTRQSELFTSSASPSKSPDDVIFNADRPVTINDGSERLLRNAGRPLHAKTLVAGLATMGKITTVNSLAGSLPQDPKKRFKKTAPSTFGLMEWEQREAHRKQNEV